MNFPGQPSIALQFPELRGRSPKITRIDIGKMNVAMDPLVISLGVIDMAKNIFIRIHTDDGMYGVGEGSPFRMIVGETQETCFAVAVDFAGILKGKNPLDIESRMDELNAYIACNTTVKSAFDMALFDLLGQYAGLPLFRLLGGEKRLLITDETIGISNPDSMAERAKKLAAKGAPAIKVKLGTNREDDVARIRSIRSVIGPDLPIRVDANQGWDCKTAVAVLKEISGYKVQYCEEPVKRWDNAGLKWVRENSPVPIMADESVFDYHDARRLVSMGAVDYINIKLAKTGGILTALKVNAVAQQAGIKCMIGAMGETRLGLSASAHFACASPNVVFADLDPPFGQKADPVKGGMYFKGYEVHLPDAPGLGADLDEVFFREMEKVSI